MDDQNNPIIPVSNQFGATGPMPSPTLSPITGMPIPTPVSETTTTTTTTPISSTTSTTTVVPTPPEVQWPEKKKKSKLPRILAGITAIVLVFGVAVGAYFVSQRVARQAAIAPTAPTKPFALGCNAGTVSNGLCEQGGIAISQANCCVPIGTTPTPPGLHCPTGYVSNGNCEGAAPGTTISVANCCQLAPTPTPTPTVTPTLTPAPGCTSCSGGTACNACSAAPNQGYRCKCSGTAAGGYATCTGSVDTTCGGIGGGGGCFAGPASCLDYSGSCVSFNTAADCSVACKQPVTTCTLAPNAGCMIGAGTCMNNSNQCVSYANAAECSSVCKLPVVSCSSGGACTQKWYFAITTEENADGTNKGKCKQTTDNYNAQMKNCTYPTQTCSDNLKAALPIELEGLATCHNDESSCVSEGGNTGFRFYFNAALNKCASTNHRYDTSERDVDDINHKTCAVSIEQWDNIPTGQGVCYKTMLACTSAQCTATTWTPAADTVCTGTNVEQTSNCGVRQTVPGTKVCTSGTPNISLEKKAYQNESSNVAGTYALTNEINKVSRNQTYVYAFKVTNSGSTKADSIEVTDTLKGDNQEMLTLIDADSRCTYSATTRIVKCSGMSLAAGANGTYAFRVQVSGTPVNGDRIKDVGTLTYKDMPSGTVINASYEVTVSTVVGCNNTCTGDTECVAGLSCDSGSGKCRRPSCSDVSSCNCPLVVVEEPTAGPTVRTVYVTQRPQPTALPEAGILDFPGVAAFGGGLLLAIVGILLAL